MNVIPFKLNDGGYEVAYGRPWPHTRGDCVPRAIAIATEQDYTVVYNALRDLNRNVDEWIPGRNTKKRAKLCGRIRGSNPCRGTYKEVSHYYLESIGWKQVKLPGWTLATDLPKGRIIGVGMKHKFALIDGVVEDTYNSGMTQGVYNRDGDWVEPRIRKVHSYFIKA